MVKIIFGIKNTLSKIFNMWDMTMIINNLNMDFITYSVNSNIWIQHLHTAFAKCLYVCIIIRLKK